MRQKDNDTPPQSYQYPAAQVANVRSQVDAELRAQSQRSRLGAGDGFFHTVDGGNVRHDAIEALGRRKIQRRSKS